MKSFALAGAWLAAALLVSLAAPAQAAQGWELLGTRTVSFGGDIDRIDVGRNEGLFRTIMFEVDSGAVEMRNVRVTFANGQTYSPLTELVFTDDERSRTIDLPGAARAIRSITFNYRSLRTGQGTATIRVWGR